MNIRGVENDFDSPFLSAQHGVTFVSTSGAIGFIAAIRDKKVYKRLRLLQECISSALDNKKKLLSKFDEWRSYTPDTQCLAYIKFKIVFNLDQFFLMFGYFILMF